MTDQPTSPEKPDVQPGTLPATSPLSSPVAHPIALAHGAGVDRKMLEALVCPLTQRPLDYDRDAQELISRSANLAFPIRDGIPIMLPDEARPLE
jgi:uncharacterized protein YbaR (Trm112 family)